MHNRPRHVLGRKPEERDMKTAPNYSPVVPQRTQSWPPVSPGVSAVDTNHWQSRAARGFTWNRRAPSPRRPH